MNKLRAEGALLAEPFDFKSEEVQLTICSVPKAGTAVLRQLSVGTNWFVTFLP